MKKLICIILVCFTLSACSTAEIPEIKLSDIKDSEGINFNSLSWDTSREGVEKYFGITNSETTETTETTETVVTDMYLADFDKQVEAEFYYEQFLTDEKSIVRIKLYFGYDTEDEALDFFNDYENLLIEMSETNEILAEYSKGTVNNGSVLVSETIGVTNSQVLETNDISLMEILDMHLYYYENDEIAETQNYEVMIDIGIARDMSLYDLTSE